jgi:hypothetical protein
MDSNKKPLFQAAFLCRDHIRLGSLFMNTALFYEYFLLLLSQGAFLRDSKEFLISTKYLL